MRNIKKTDKDRPEKKSDGGIFRRCSDSHGYCCGLFKIHGLLSFLERNTSDRKNTFYLALISTVLFIVPIIFIDLQFGDETRVAGISAEMILDGDFLTPRLNGKTFLEYPPLYYIAAAANYRLFGFCSFAAKLPSALSALAGVLMLYLLMRRLHHPKWEAFAGAFMLATGSHYLSNAYDCRVDMMLSAFCILSWLGFVQMEFSSGGRVQRLIGMLLLSLGIAGGLLTKNLPGIVIPLSGIGCTLIFCDLAKRTFSFPAYCRTAAAVLLGILPYAIYLLLLYTEHGMSAVKTIFLYNNFGRFSGVHQDHSSPFWHYLKNLPGLFPPYLPFLLAGLFLRFRTYRSSRSILQISFLLIPFLILSAASGKRLVYLLPLAAPASMIAASALPYFICICQFVRRDITIYIRRWLKPVTAAAVLLIALISSIIGYHISHQDSFAPVYAEIKSHPPRRNFVLIRPSERLSGAAVFYCHAVIPVYKTLDDLKKNDVALLHLGKDQPVPQLPDGFAARHFVNTRIVLILPAGK